MASLLIGKAGKKLFEKHLEQYAPADPVYEYFTSEDGKEKRRRRELPPGLSKRDTKILKSVQKRAHRLDKGFTLCGFRFGWMFIIGIIPVAGDAASAAINYTLIVRKAKQAELPSWLVRRMMMNMTVAGGFGLVPFVGDVVATTIRPNSRNAALLEEFLRIRGEDFLKAGDVEAIEAAATRKGKGKQVETVKGVNVKDATEDVKPGAGVEKGEIVPGAKRGGFFGRKSKTPPVTETRGPVVPVGEGQSRFVEGVPSSRR
ncbi:hypothetical protein BDV98DRAFT_573225 [Pterulicium gracile]|uniref:Uncharacterized protein n=1 Tax=Pterulicium gracile TaxID=1884261 RepID=A0A5C3QIN4_9AGAR|nr:hypothetical protein BDV98DRAFT_573225 [Pterula gracilis]